MALVDADFAMGSAGAAGQQQVPTTSFRPEDVHILLVDDENVSRMVVGNLLRKCNYKGAAPRPPARRSCPAAAGQLTAMPSPAVTVADSGQQALELLRQSVPGTYQLILTVSGVSRPLAAVRSPGRGWPGRG